MDDRYITQEEIALLAISPATEIFVAGADFTPGVSLALTLANLYNSVNNIEVFFDASYQGPDQYDLIGHGLSFTSPIPVGVEKVYVRGGASRLVVTPSDGAVTDASIATGSHLFNRVNDVRSIRDFGARCDGVTDDSLAFQAASNAVPAGETWEIFVPASSVVNSTVTAGLGTIAWNFAQEVELLGTGTIPYQAATMGFNSTPNVGKRLSIWHGTNANPTTDGVTSTAYIQRVDKSVVGDDPAHLISSLYVTHKRLPGGTGWLYGGYFYLEDQSTTGTAQSVALAASAHGITKGAVWGLYSEVLGQSPNVTMTAIEVDTFNFTNADYAYNDAFPTTAPFSAGMWNISFGQNKNSFAHGIASGSIANQWHVGIYMKTFSIDHIGIDIQAQPPTLINFKYGASTDGTGITPGGIGLDVGAQINAAYGSGANQCAIHMRDQRLGFGNFGFMQFNPTSGFLEIWSSPSTRAVHLNLSTGVWIAG
ncbi:hypothetical protein [Caballeronia glathei]|uniref:hypothetical protein n=1 Tax=Caballeronia glathei TaxID=60547 RepID=UPI000B19F53C|nr:hypothetical protein [Caballeronia glathei]